MAIRRLEPTMPIAASPRVARVLRHPDAVGHCAIVGGAVGLTALGLYATASPVSAPIRAGQVAWSPPLLVVGIAWVALNAAGTVAACLLWRERRDSRAAQGALLLLALAVVLHLAWLGAFLVAASAPGPQLWLVLVPLLALDLVAAALASAAWSASRAAGVLLFVVLAGLLAGTALALGDTVLVSSLL